MQLTPKPAGHHNYLKHKQDRDITSEIDDSVTSPRSYMGVSKSRRLDVGREQIYMHSFVSLHLSRYKVVTTLDQEWFYETP